ncbi:MAG: methyltransferase domain-containing protein [Candidatus Eisenbacteria bacterium]
MGRGLRLILDARSREAFLAGHAPAAAHLPAGDWDEHAAELPARELGFEVVGEDPAATDRLATELWARGFTHVRPASAETLADRSECGAARAVLWRPSPWLTECAPHLPVSGPALDVACGSGRHAVWLAARGLATWGCDRLPDALRRARALAQAACDLDASSPSRPRAEVGFAVVDATRELPWRDHEFAVICGFRYLDRVLFPRLARHLAPGGFLVWETFTREQARFGKPHRPEFLLEPGEAERLCASAGLRIVAAREHVAPGGPALGAVLARRPEG